MNDNILKFFCAVISSFAISLIVVYFMSVCFFPKPMEISRNDKVFIAKCPKCDNLIVSLSKKDRDAVGYYFTRDCNYFKENPEYAKVITRTDPDYDYFFLKYHFYRSGGRDFDKFMVWYESNKDREFFKYVRKYKVIVDEPIYKTETSHRTRLVGKMVQSYSVQHYVITGYKQVPIMKTDTKYAPQDNPGYNAVSCDIFEYYVNTEGA